MTQPFCDGSHEGTDMEPMSIVIEEKTTVWLCRWLSAESPQKRADVKHSINGSASAEV